MDIKTRKEKGVLVVDVIGRLDALSSPQFDKVFKSLADKGESQFLINLSGLDYISSAGLRSILAGANLMKAKGGRFMLAGLQGAVKETFEITHLHQVLDIHDSTEAALGPFR
jgi:anti-anti-sigma factor